jgi:colanic acid/amylovoran biosynthesis glycosyltransferase
MVTFHGYDANLHPRYAFRKKYRRLFQQADLCTANSHYTRAKVIELGCDPAKIRVLPMGIRLDRFPFAARRLPAGETLHVLTVARLVEKKGIAYGICAVALLARTCAVRYTIVGEGPQRKLLHALVGALGMHEQIVLVGQQDEHAVRAYYAQAHVFMLPSVSARDGDEEGQGVVLQEAQAMGLPVVATHHNGFPESVLDGVSGVLVPERNVEALAEALRQLREQESAWPQMGAAGRQFVSERFDMQLLAQQLVELYTELCQ